MNHPLNCSAGSDWGRRVRAGRQGDLIREGMKRGRLGSGTIHTGRSTGMREAQRKCVVRRGLAVRGKKMLEKKGEERQAGGRRSGVVREK